ncbi:MAG: HesA/MoeB/ThiF family protein [Candidatus Bathyarchaeota archaeon]|nr:MAG: HesA/MoeB/ThiF family protein [Candidatus Bathyarchaeota archaeon]
MHRGKSGSTIRFDSNEYYKRQVVMSELGREGQERLSRSKVAVIGLGGLGSAATQYLALAGVGYLRLVDQDTVELDNLHRQVLYSLEDLRFPKVESALRRVEETNPEIHVEPIPENVRKSNIDKILEGVDCVVDGLDNVYTRYLVNKVCVEKRIPYIYAAAIGIEGYLSVFSLPETPCLACIFPNLNDSHLPTCETRGVLGATTGVIGTMEAMETIKLLTGIGNTLKNTLLILDFYDVTIAKIVISKNPECPVCGKGEKRNAIRAEQFVWLCGQKTVNVNPRKPLKLSVNEIHSRLRKRFEVLLKSSLVVVLKHKDAEVSLFKGGRTLIKNVESEQEALDIYESIAKHLKTEAD